MASLYEYYNTGDDNSNSSYDDRWVAQTFTTSLAYKITSVKLKLYRVGAPGTVTVSIQSIISGNPSGSDLCSGTYNGNLLTTDTAGEWVEFAFGAGTQLSASTVYAIVLKSQQAASSNRTHWRSVSTGTYAGGQVKKTTDAGSSWDNYTSDAMFENWGSAGSQKRGSFANLAGKALRFG